MTLYKGRIDAEYGELMQALNRSLPVDIRLLPYDVLTNRAWTGELARLGILSAAERDAVSKALDDIAAKAVGGVFDPLPGDEDVHTLVERLLTERTGEAGAKIHTGRSRNDQVVCDLRMYAADRLAETSGDIARLVRTLSELSSVHAATLLPGATHMQPAQPITLGFFLLSLAFALLRDIERLDGAHARTNLCPLGAGALAGAAFGVDRERLARDLGFAGICENALDATGARDFAQEIAADCAILTADLSRFAEQFVIWAHPAFGFVRFADEWSTGSSMMPQKRNPDAMELIRAKAARCLGLATALLALTKGLPPGYSKDLQEDKAALFELLDTVRLCVLVFERAVATAKFDAARMDAALTGDLLATDLTDELARGGVPFREAHERVGRLVSHLEKTSRTILDASRKEIAEFCGELPDSLFPLSFERSIQKRSVPGGTAPDEVRKQALEIEKRLAARKPVPVRIPRE